jgi:CHAD domain-containing protein
MHEVLEREEKWSADGDFRLPAVDDVSDDTAVHTDTVELESVYYDTADDDLRAHGIVVRRRNGDDDTGWQAKLPAGDGKLELHWPLSDTPPVELVRLLTGAALGKDLAIAATIRTTRTRHRVTVGRQLRYEVAEDDVRASSGAELRAWREIEVELGPDLAAVPKKLRRRLRDAGATRSAHPSTLAHATGLLTAPAAPRKAAAALIDYLDEQLDQIMIGDVDLRRGLHPIHDTRVAIRRLRSVLRVFGDALSGVPAGFDSELKWFAGLLGEVRDSQVQQKRFAEAVDALPEELVLGPVRARISSDLQAIELPALTAVDEAMQTPRYLDLLTVLRQWRTQRPVDPGVRVKAVRSQARKASSKADRRLDHGVKSDDPALLHRARKAAKRARYAAELVAPLDPAADRRRTKHEKVQSILGDHQDTVVAVEALRRLAIAAGTSADENGFTFGLLYAREQRIAEDSRAEARRFKAS